MPVSMLEDHCDASGATIYRRLADRGEYDLIVKRTEPDLKGGAHREVSAATPRGIMVKLRDSCLEFAVQRRELMADRLTRLVEGR